MPLLCFASPKGGVGKTTLTANVAHALRRGGRRVLVIDTDPQNTLRLHFGAPVSDQAGYLAALRDIPDWRMAVRQTASGVLLLPHGAMELRAALALNTALEREPDLLAAPLRAMLADPDLLVIADTPPGPSQVLSILAPMAALIVAILRAEPISAAMMPDIDNGRFLGSGTMAALHAGRLRIVLNEVDLHSRLSRATADALARHLGPRLLGAVSRDDGVAEALAGQRLVLDAAPDCTAAADIRDIARAIALALPVAGAAPAGAFAPGGVSQPGWGAR